MCQASPEIMEPEINKITEKVRKETETGQAPAVTHGLVPALSWTIWSII